VTRARFVAAGAALIAALLAAPGAHAQLALSDEPLPEYGYRHYHSPKGYLVQVSFGPYRPNIDSEFKSGRTPYNDYFGPDRHLMSQFEFDYEIFQRMGSVSIGLGAGYFRVSGTAPVANHSATPSGDKSEVTVIPVSLSAVYRFDHYLVTDDFPLVPHAKLGLDWDYWSMTDGNGEIATDYAGNKARGGTLGRHAVLGLALVIDKLDPDAAKQFDVEMGVNHSALVFEYGHYDVSGLFQSDRLHVGDTTWTLGLLFEF
jgi:hypothetical protein